MVDGGGLLSRGRWFESIRARFGQQAHRGAKRRRRNGDVRAQLFVATTFTEIYERVLVGPLFRPFAEQLVAQVAPQRGDSLIDVACGTGIVARVAREHLGPEARIVGVDVAPAMLAVARSVDQTIDWRQGNATSLPVANAEHFTVLTCHQGLQFMSDKPAAIREMRRVLVPGGRVAFRRSTSLARRLIPSATTPFACRGPVQIESRRVDWTQCDGTHFARSTLGGRPRV